VPVPEADLPVILPEDCVPDGSGNPLAKRADFVNCPCPKCGQPARRETDTMDTFVDSAWYYMRYACPDAPTMVDARNDYWNPMDQYIGGISHAILHLLYARFWTKVMRDMGMVKMDEPFTRLLTQGMVLNHSYFRRTDKGGVDYIAPENVETTRDPAGHVTGARSRADGRPVEYGGLGTMSKSKLNGVDPQDIIDQYGADAGRLFVMFAAHPEATLEWSNAGVDGAHRFLKRLWHFGQTHAATVMNASGPFDFGDAAALVKAARRDLHVTLKQANYDYERVQYNTVVSAGMKMLNTLEGVPATERGGAALLCEGLSILLRALYPVVPHTAWVLWQDLGYAAKQGDLIDAPWPEVDAAALVQEEVELMLQVNGKLRGKLSVPAAAAEAAIDAAARAHAEVVKYADGKPVKKVIIVPGRLVNVVV
jgi:leucyl-tRNA synthetase